MYICNELKDFANKFLNFAIIIYAVLRRSDLFGKIQEKCLNNQQYAAEGANPNLCRYCMLKNILEKGATFDNVQYYIFFYSTVKDMLHR